MGKRRPVIVLSSSSSSSSENEDGQRDSAGGGRRASRSRLGKLPVSRKKVCRGRAKKDRFSGEATLKVKAEFDMLSENFSECLHDFSLTQGFLCNAKELWVDKHKPTSLAELAVHKKKVEEVRRWLEERVKISKQGSRNCTLLLTGQAGVGKSATIRTLASELDAVLYEWKAPIPTLWQEHLHNNVNSGLRYVSKLEEFENFVESIRKFPLLPATRMADSGKPIILLIDDIPFTNGRVGFARLNRCLTDFTCWTQVPTVILITHYCKPKSIDDMKYEELELSLERAGAHKVAFKPITANSIKRTLLRVCKEEKCDVTTESIDLIAKASGGDIRNAIASLQYYCLKPENLVSAVRLGSTHSESNSCDPCSLLDARQEDNSLNCTISLPFGRDETLSLFHALGKFLHNKRETCKSAEVDLFILQERLRRNQLKMDSPEKVLSQVDGQTQTVIDFLFENVLDFINDEAVDDAGLVASYLSDADCLLCGGVQPSLHRVTGERHKTESLTQSIAVSVAARGVLFGNSQPSSRWHPIRSPRIWQIEQSLRYSEVQIFKKRFENSRTIGSYSISAIATDFRPTMRWLDSQKAVGVHTSKKCFQHPDDIVDDSDLMDISDYEGNESDIIELDEIEDW
ncbi:cell cycle checkpoint protein RAD17 isoform X2 [Ananas comosus]|uniref:Cell cycle checkpoint protein RAD17 isoform X2 n=1 Tax=Ananas comosus TaxID=4615 RepID=A0A6P5FCL2_ANACO|nr:cell cycle checkpoint protein RAD17 isoform X2 [Ananas comosus]